MNETIERMLHRSSLRAFSDRPVDEQTRSLLKQVTLQAPNGGNMMCYSVVEITDQDKKDALCKLCEDQQMISKASLLWIFLADFEKWDRYFKESGAVERAETQGIGYRPPGLGDLHIAMQDAVIAAQSAVVAADSLGLGSCYIGDVIMQYGQVARLLSLAPRTVIATMVVFGYPRDDGYRPAPKERCPADSIFFENRYRVPDLREAYGPTERKLQAQNRLPYRNTGTMADYAYLTKHTAPYRKAMNESARGFVHRWEDGGQSSS
jgi:nitroreductase